MAQRVQVPKSLYKYQAHSTNALENLKSRQIWFSAPARFNDPYDCGISVIQTFSDSDLLTLFDYCRSDAATNPTAFDVMYLTDGVPNSRFREEVARGSESAFNKQRSIQFEQRGVACFSRKNDDLLMWSHYADGHRGFCLEFDGTLEPFFLARQVKYLGEIPKLNPIQILTNSEKDHLFEVLKLTKAQCWSYEEEWRLCHKEANRPYGYHYDALTGVYFGAAMPPASREIIALILQGSPTILYEMLRRDDGFSVYPQSVTFTPFCYT
jgi:hypothetical protein